MPVTRRATNAAHVLPPDPTCKTCAEDMLFHLREELQMQPMPTARPYLQDLRRRHVVPFTRRATNAAHVRPPDPTCRTCAEDMLFHSREEQQMQPMSYRQSLLPGPARKTCCSIERSTNAAHVRPSILTFRICAEDMLFHWRDEPQMQPMSYRQSLLLGPARKTCCSIAFREYHKTCKRAAKQEEQPPNLQIINIQQERLMAHDSNHQI